MKHYLFLLILSVVVVGCSTQPTQQNTNAAAATTDEAPSGLTRPIVLDLLQKKLAPLQVFAHMNTTSRTLSDFTPIYKQMIDENLIACKWSESCKCWVSCRPTEAHEEDIRLETQEEAQVSGTLRVEMGWKELTEVVGISKISDTSAVAEYIIGYTPPDSSRPEPAIVQKYQQVFRMDNRETEKHRAFLRKYDDGWRIERLD